MGNRDLGQGISGERPLGVGQLGKEGRPPRSILSTSTVDSQRKTRSISTGLEFSWQGSNEDNQEK